MILGLLKRILQRLQFNGAVAYTIFGHVVSTVSIPIVSWLILKHLSLVEQGYYYTFGSLLALQAVFELGFGQCITQFVAHEYPKLRIRTSDATITGDSRARSRFITLGHYSLRFYFGVALLAFIGLTVVGWLFFRSNPQDGIDWQWPWLLMCAGTALNLITIGATSFLQGCNEVAWIAKIRAISNVARPLVLAASLACGLKLLAPGFAMLGSLGLLTFIIAHRWGGFFYLLSKRKPESKAISWSGEFWPFQWRIALSWAFSYLAFSLFNPIVFRELGPEVAGRFGFTWSLLQNVSIVASVWNGTAAPRYASMVATGDVDGLRDLWRRNSIVAFGICAAGSSFVLALGPILHALGSVYADRILDFKTTLWLALACLINNIVLAFAVYLRSHKRDPLVVHSVLNGALVCVVVALTAKYADINKVALANFLTTALCFGFAYLIFTRGRKALSPQEDSGHLS